MSVVVSLRLKTGQYEALKEYADQKGHSVALLARDILEEWMSHQDKKPFTFLEKMHVQGLSETLYILRVMADKFEPNLKDAAKLYAEKRLQMLMEDRV